MKIWVAPIGFLSWLTACVEPTSVSPPCADGCVAQPCVGEYTLFMRPEFENAPADVRSVLDECDPTDGAEPASQFDCPDNRSATVAYLNGRFSRVQFFADGRLDQDLIFEYSVEGLLLFFSRSEIDGEDISVSLVDTLTWNGSLPATEDVTLLTPAAVNGSVRSLDGDHRRYATARAWDEEGFPELEEFRLGAESVLAQRNEYTWRAGELVKVVTTIDTGRIDEPALNWPGCDALGGGVFECETSFVYENGEIVSFRTLNETTSVSDHCCVALCSR